MHAHRTTTSDAIASPEASFASPWDLASRQDLTLEEKLEALKRWEEAVQARLAATSEGMPANGTGTHDLDLIREIGKASDALLDHRHAGEPS